MKVGIVTAHWPRNYGAVLQAHALTKTLNLLGYDCEIINFMTDFQGRHLLICPPLAGTKPKEIASWLWRTSNSMFRYRAWKKRKENFQDFARNYLPVSTKRYRNYAELIAEPPHYDAYICGSDQIWRSIEGSTTKFDPTYYLSFVEDRKKRIAYAPSFGADFIPSELENDYKERILGIPHLSIRELSGQEIIYKLTGIKPPVVLDPTLLLPAEYWHSILMKPALQSPYLLVYVVAGNLNKMGELIGVVKQKIGNIKVVAITDNIINKIHNVDLVISSAHPLEFLGWFSKAHFVCTTSFHGMIFSFIFRKPFYALMPRLISTRLDSLGTLLGLGSRLLKNNFSIPNDCIEFDYSEAEKRYDKLRERSLQFLNDTLLKVMQS